MIPPKDSTGKPLVMLMTNSHMQYEFHAANRAFENHSAISATAGVGRLGFNGRIYCFEDHGSMFVQKWYFDCGPRMLKAGDTLPAQSFRPGYDFYRTFYPANHFVGKLLSDGNGGTEVKMQGAQRVYLHPDLKAHSVDSQVEGDTQTFTDSRMVGSTATIGYINLGAGPYAAGDPIPVYATYQDAVTTGTRLVIVADTERHPGETDADARTRYANNGGTVDMVTGEVITTLDYLGNTLKTPFMITSYSAMANTYVFPDDDMAHGFNYFGSGVWSPGSFCTTKSGRNLFFFASGNAQMIPVEDQLFMKRASQVAKTGSESAADATYGPYGAEFDPYAGSYGRWVEENKEPGSLEKSGIGGFTLDTHAYLDDAGNMYEKSSQSGADASYLANFIIKRTGLQPSLLAIHKALKTSRQRRPPV